MPTSRLGGVSEGLQPWLSNTVFRKLSALCPTYCLRRWEAIASVLTSLGLSAEGRVLARCRGPPEAQLELHFSAAADREAA